MKVLRIFLAIVIVQLIHTDLKAQSLRIVYDFIQDEVR